MAEVIASASEAKRFRAFVSYSHADARFAARLQRRLETYRLPRALGADDSSPVGAAPRRLGAIFRDRADLAAADDLSTAIREALAQSAALIVVCSPDAKVSRWVTREIDVFRELNPGAPILAALVSGTPDSAMPLRLIANGNEPLAADFRREGDGDRLGFIKIVAGVAGVPLDALIQRDAQRRLRRVMAITLAALLALLGTSVMTIMAITARKEAETQRAGAEGLVEYMLTDLRSQLKGVGRLDVMTGVNGRALRFYEAQGDLDRFPVESLERRARILQAMGEDDLARADLSAANAKFSEAHRTTAALLARAPANPDRIFSHAQSEYWLGYIGYVKKDWQVAQRHFGLYKARADELIQRDPDPVRALREAGYAEGNLCTLAIDRKQHDAAMLARCSAALTRMRMVLERLPDNAQAIEAVANRESWVARAQIARRNFAEALPHYRAAEALVARLIKRDPRNRDFQDFAIRCQMGLSEVLIGLGRFDEARARLDAATSATASLRALDPANHSWQSLAERIAILRGKTE